MSKTSDEAMARLEHKVDLILDMFMGLAKKNRVVEMRNGSHECPVCRVGVKYVIDMQDKSVSRHCGCKTGLFAPIDLEQFAPPSAAGGKSNVQDRGSRDSASEGDAVGGELEQHGPRRR